jgi:hypothetical protein
MPQSANWEAFSIQLPGQNLLQGVRNILETLLTFLEIAKAILETIKAFLLDFGNPLILLLKALIALILDLLKALQQTGLYAYYDIPDPFRDPSFKGLAGGFQAFKNRWKGSLLDVRDSNRPQPVAGLLQGGFFLIVLDADGPLALIQLVKSIMAFFKNSKRFIFPQYPAPLHLKAVPITPKGDPILALSDLLSTQVTSLALEWKLPGTVPTGDVGFAGLTSQIVQQFRVPNWLIEIGTSPPVKPITITPDISGAFNAKVMSDPSTTGRLVQTTTTPFTDPRNLGSTFNGLAPVTDEYGDPIVKFSYYAIIDGFAAFLQAQLGTVRFVFEDVPLDQEFYFRVRAFFGELATTDHGAFVTLNWQSPLLQRMSDGSGIFYLPWPSTDPTTQMSMGKPSAMIRGKIATNPTFDVLGDLRAIFETAFSLNFHESLPAALPEKNAQGQVLLDARKNPIYYPLFDSAGNPVVGGKYNPPAMIGQGSIADLAGSVAGNIFVAPPAAFTAADFQPDPAGITPTMPWQQVQTRYQASRLAIRFGNILLEQGGGILQAFQNIMRGPLPAGPVDVSWKGGLYPFPTTLEQLVLTFTQVEVTPSNPVPSGTSESGTSVSTVTPAVAAALESAGLNTSVSLATAKGYALAFPDASVRRNVLAAINFLKALNLQGTPPNWISVSLLDLIPWSGQILYDLVAKIQALIDAFNGVIQEIIDFINLIERKINAMEQFIEYLISILNFLLNLEVSFALLPVPSITGDVSSWLSTIDEAGGAVPSSGPSGFTAGICIAYLAPDITEIVTAFGLIF